MSLDLRPEALAVLGAFALGWLSRNLLHRALDRKLRGVLDLVAGLSLNLEPNANDLQWLARLVWALRRHAVRARPGWCPAARQEVREMIARLETLHGTAWCHAREDLREMEVPSER